MAALAEATPENNLSRSMQRGNWVHLTMLVVQ